MKRAEVSVLEDRCKACEYCVATCPNNLLALSNKFNKKGYHPVEFNDKEEKCTGCALCYTVCPDVALEVIFYKNGKNTDEG